MTHYARRIETQRRCDCGERARYRYLVLIADKIVPIYLCAGCLIAELEMQLDLAGRSGPPDPMPLTEAEAVVRRYISLEREKLAISPQQQDANVAQARRLLATLRQLELVR